MLQATRAGLDCPRRRRRLLVLSPSKVREPSSRRRPSSSARGSRSDWRASSQRRRARGPTIAELENAILDGDGRRWTISQSSGPARADDRTKSASCKRCITSTIAPRCLLFSRKHQRALVVLDRRRLSASEVALEAFIGSSRMMTSAPRPVSAPRAEGQAAALSVVTSSVSRWRPGTSSQRGNSSRNQSPSITWRVSIHACARGLRRKRRTRCAWLDRSQGAKP